MKEIEGQKWKKEKKKQTKKRIKKQQSREWVPCWYENKTKINRNWWN